MLGLSLCAWRHSPCTAAILVPSCAGMAVDGCQGTDYRGQVAGEGDSPALISPSGPAPPCLWLGPEAARPSLHRGCGWGRPRPAAVRWLVGPHGNSLSPSALLTSREVSSQPPCQGMARPVPAGSAPLSPAAESLSGAAPQLPQKAAVPPVLLCRSRSHRGSRCEGFCGKWSDSEACHRATAAPQ